MMAHRQAPLAPARQKGATLVMALIVLVMIMIIGVVAMGSSATQFKLASNLQFDNNAINNAEIAISAAENWLSTGNNSRAAGFSTYTSATPSLYPIAATDAVVASPLATKFTSSIATCVDSNTACASSYTIQLLSTNNTTLGSSVTVGGPPIANSTKVNLYQIVGRGLGGRGASKTVVSYYSVLVP